jgi:multiple sugar transport system permease protein
MEPRTRFGKTLAYTLLAAGSFLFIFPFIWLVSTALKPLEQAATMPPRWVPYQYRADLDGSRRDVVRGEAIPSPMVVVRLRLGQDDPRNGQQLLVPVSDYHNGTVVRKVGGVDQELPAELIHKVEPGWRYIKERKSQVDINAPAAWDVVPPETIEARPKLFWGSFPEAIRKMGTVRVWLPFLGQREVSIFWLYLRNTLVVCILGVMGTLISSSLVGYSLAKIPWRGRGLLFGITLATMMIPFAVLMVPLYTLFARFGWIGTLLPLWVPAFFGSGFNIFLLRQFFLTIPKDLSEAARIDGCGEFGIFWRIILPLSKPALAVVALFHFLYAWNDFMGPLLFLTRRETYTLSLGLQSFQSQHGGTDWTSLMAASTLICLPIIVLFFFTQKTFIKGIATTGLKG